MPAGYGHREVKDLANKVSVVVEAHIVEDCDTEDDESVDECLAALRKEWAKRDEPRYNIVVDLGSNGERYMIGEDGEWDCEPLPYCQAWECDDAIRLVSEARKMYVGAWTSEVEPFEF